MKKKFSFWNLFSRTHWKLVKTIKIAVSVTRFGYTTDLSVYYHLYESNKGKRKCKIESSSPVNLKADDPLNKGTDTYQETVYRWLAGRHDPNIPTYDSVDEEDTMNALRGSIE